MFDGAGRILYKRPSTLDEATIAKLAQRRLAAERERHPLGWIRFFTVDLGDQSLTAAALRTGSGTDQRIIIVFKGENAPDVLVDDVVRAFPYRALQVMLPIFALLLLGGGFIIWGRTRPLARASAIAATIGPTTLNLRLPERDLPGDVLPIVRGVNGALERLEQAAAAQREFLRRAAHQLRTPMAVLSARIDSLDDAATAAPLRSDVKELARIVAQLLQLNEIDALPDHSAATADLAAVGEAARDELLPAAGSLGIDIVLARPAAPVLVKGDPNIIEIAVDNLIENALQHALAGSAVELRVADDASLTVTNRGPGIHEADREHLFEPFWSGDGQDSRAGLGLTIVRRIAERYAATVFIEHITAGGARFVMRFRRISGPVEDSAATIPVNFALRRRRQALDRAAE